jgi:dephospho-CoA kinase
MTNTIILLSGKQGSGKTTLMNMLSYTLSNTLGMKTMTTHVANGVYKVADTIYDAILRPQSERGKDRKMLQTIAEYYKTKYGEQFWIDQTLKDVIRFFEVERSDYVCIDGIRFPYEIETVRNIGSSKGYRVIVINLTCSEEVRRSRCSAYGNDIHISEVALDQYKDFDVVYNTETDSVIDCMNKIVCNILILVSE